MYEWIVMGLVVIGIVLVSILIHRVTRPGPRRRGNGRASTGSGVFYGANTWTDGGGGWSGGGSDGSAGGGGGSC